MLEESYITFRTQYWNGVISIIYLINYNRKYNVDKLALSCPTYVGHQQTNALLETPTMSVRFKPFWQYQTNVYNVNYLNYVTYSIFFLLLVQIPKINVVSLFVC